MDEFKPEEVVIPVELVDVSVLDGGRTSYYCCSNEKNFVIRIVHNGFEDIPFKTGYCPGGIYFDNSLLEVNSIEEKIICNILGTMNVQNFAKKFDSADEEFEDSEQLLLHMIRSHIKFIGSKDYYRLAKITGRI